MANYSWNPVTRRYRNTDTGRAVPLGTIVKTRDDLVRQFSADARLAADALIAGTLSPAQFVIRMRGLVKDATLAEYMLGRGGRAQMTPADRGRTGGLLRAQYRYLDAFAADIVAGEVTPDQIRNRASLYAESARGAYERGYASAWGITLPTYPGQQACRVRCRCRWKIVEKKRAREVHATWLRNAGAESCEDCIDNAATYAPLILPMP